MDYIKRLPLGTTPLPFNTAPAAAGYRRMHRIEPFRSKQKNSILRDMYLQNYFEEKESLTNLVSKADVRGFCPPERAAQPYALYR